MSGHARERFRPLTVCVLTVSDSRGPADDRSGSLLGERLLAAGHCWRQRCVVPDDRYRIRAAVSAWIAEPEVEAILVNGGTGVTERDVTPEAVRPLLDRELPGFGESFRACSREEIGMAAIQSRALAGVANATLLVALPGSTGACATAWDRILAGQLDARSEPCSLAALLPERAGGR